MPQVTLTITAEDQASGPLSKIGEGLDALGKKSTEASGATDKLKDSTEKLGTTVTQTTGSMENLQRVTGAIAAGFASAKLTHFLRDIAETRARTEQLGIVMNVIAKQAGIMPGLADDLSKAMQKQGITAQEANSAVTKFIQSNLELAKALKLARGAQDAATISGENSSQSLQGLVHGIVTLQPEVLRTRGVIVTLEQELRKAAQTTGRTAQSFSGTEKQALVFAAVLRELEKLTGAYEASMTNASKQLKSMERYIEEAKEALGESLQPAYLAIILTINDFLKAVANADPVVLKFAVSIGILTTAIVSMAAAIAGFQILGLKTAFAALFTGPGLAVVAIAALVSIVVVFWEDLGKLYSRMTESAPWKAFSGFLSDASVTLKTFLRNIGLLNAEMDKLDAGKFEKRRKEIAHDALMNMLAQDTIRKATKDAADAKAAAEALEAEKVKKANKALESMIESLTIEMVKLREGEHAALRYKLSHGELAKGSEASKKKILDLTVALEVQKHVLEEAKKELEELAKATFVLSAGLLPKLTEQIVAHTSAEDLLAERVKKAIKGMSDEVDKAIPPLGSLSNAFGRVNKATMILSEDMERLDKQYGTNNINVRDAIALIDRMVKSEMDYIDALEALKKLTPLEADRARVDLLTKQRNLLEGVRAAVKDLNDPQALVEFDTMLLQISGTIKNLKDETVLWKQAFDGFFDILSLFGVKIGKLIIMLQAIPRALGGLEKIAGAIGGIIQLSAPAAAGAAELLPGLSQAESEIASLGQSAAVASGDLGIFGSLLGWASRLLSIFGGGLGTFGSKIGDLLIKMGVPAGAAGAIGRGAAGGMLGFGVGSFLGGPGAKYTGMLGGAVGSLAFGPVGGVIAAIVSSLAGKLSDIVTKSLWSGNKGAQIGGMIGTIVFPVIGTLLGGFLGSLFGKTPKATLAASVLPFNRSNIGREFADEGVRGTQIGPIMVDVGGNIMKNSKEHELQKQLAEALNKLFKGIVDSTVKLIAVLPERLAAELDVSLSALEASGLEIVDKTWAGGKAGKKLKKRVKGLADEAIRDIVDALGFGDVDLKALGGGKRGDAAKGFDAMMSALGTVSAVIKETNADLDNYTGSLADFTKATIDWFKQFQQEGESFVDTVKRVGESVGNIVSLMRQLDQMTDTSRTLRNAIDDLNRSAESMIDALTVAVESESGPDEVLKAAQAAVEAVTVARDAEIDAITQLRDAVQALNTALNDGLDAFVELEQQIAALGGTTMATGTTIPHIVEAFNAAMDVSQQIALWSAGMRLVVAEGGNLIEQMPLIAAGFNEIMSGIRQMTNAQQAVANLNATAAGINAALSAGVAAIQARYASLRESVQGQIDVLKSQRDAIDASYDAQLDGLKAQRDAARDLHRAELDALREQMDLAREWQVIGRSARDQLVALFNLLAPTHPLTSLNEIRAQFDAARAAFAASPTTGNAAKVQDLAQQLLQLAQQTPGFELPSSTFQSLAAEIQSTLDAIATFAEGQLSVEDIQAKIADLESQQAASLASIDAKIAEVEAARDAALAKIDQRIADANAALQGTLSGLSAQEQAEIRALQQAAASGLQQVRDELGRRLLELQAQQQVAQDALQAVLGDKSFEQYIAEKQAEAAVLLRGIDTTLKQYLGAILTAIAPRATVLAMAAGGIVTRPTRALIGENGPEAVVPLSQFMNRESRIVFAPNIVVNGQTNARKLADEIEDALVEKMQTGSRLRNATQALIERRR